MSIKAVIFDMGGTIEDLDFTQESRLDVQNRIYELLKGKAPEIFSMGVEEFREKLLSGYHAYKQWGLETKEECDPAGIWGWYLRDIPNARSVTDPIADSLTEIWETGYYTRKIKPEAMELLTWLRDNGYKMGVVSNTSSCTQPYNSMKEYGIREFFGCVYLSAAEGTRKPAPKMFLDAAKALGLDTSECMYVGDQIAKDVLGSKEAKYGVSVLISSKFTMGSPYADMVDYQIQKLTEIIPILQAKK